MSTLSTHVLDTAAGLPATGIRVAPGDPRRGRRSDEGVTDARRPGRVARRRARRRRLRAAVRHRGLRAGFFPEVVVVFTIADERHHHVPVLLSPYGYSTYRGS